MKLGVIALARPTFDVPFAEDTARSAFAALDSLGEITLTGSRDLVFDADTTRDAIAALEDDDFDAVLILQVTFTDASMTVEIARKLRAPVVIWGFREERTGGRLRLNSICGINLAAHALGRAALPFSYIITPPDRLTADHIFDAVDEPLTYSIPAASPSQMLAYDEPLSGQKIGLFGKHPAGFDTCRFEPTELQARYGVTVDETPLETLFEKARKTEPGRIDDLVAETSARIAGLDEMEPEPTRGTHELYAALSDQIAARDYRAIAVRCWPETFTEYGCAICGAMAKLNGDGTPAACEADVRGAMTAALLSDIAEDDSFLVDLVDVDPDDNTAVFWHCGLAPVSMADPATPPEATVHTNRKKPLLYQFALKPGEITIARLTAARNSEALVIGTGQMLSRPRAFSGTAGVLSFKEAAETVFHRMMEYGLEHHVAFAYGNHRNALVAYANRRGLPVLDLDRP